MALSWKVSPRAGPRRRGAGRPERVCSRLCRDRKQKSLPGPECGVSAPRCGFINTLPQSQSHPAHTASSARTPAREVGPHCTGRPGSQTFLLAPFHCGTWDRALRLPQLPAVKSRRYRPYWANVRFMSSEAFMTLPGSELGTGKMSLNLCGLVTGLFCKDKNLCLFLH